MNTNWQNEQRKKYQREEYLSRIYRVIDYIDANIDQDLTLDGLASVASFSRFHFHRIFRALVGETLNHYVTRVRLEKAAALLTSNPKTSITEIAFDCGFAGSASFARAFRETFNMSASEFRAKRPFKDRKNCKTNSKERQVLSNWRNEFPELTLYIDGQTNNPIWRMKMKNSKELKVEVKEVPEMSVAYVRHIGPYAGNEELFKALYGKLMKWAGPRGLLRFPETKMLAIYHDDPKITDEAKLRTSVCITVPEDTATDGEVGKMTIPGGKFAVARFEIAGDEFEDAWNALLGGWMPESGFQCDDRLSYELCINDPKEHPERKHIVDICVPVKPL
jgi:AraC family transcriptional regulator